MIVVFAGAGASFAANPGKYPTTIEFYKTLPAEIKTDKLFNTVNEFLEKNAMDEEPIDIEKVLWKLDELTDFSSELEIPRTIIGWLLSHSGSLDQPFNLPELKRMAPQLQDQITKLAGMINQQVYRLCSKLPSEEELEHCWLPLLLPLVESPERIELFTTNYDQVLEECIQVMHTKREVHYLAIGRTVGVQTQLDIPLWDPTLDNHGRLPRGGLLTKLHGSIDWRRDGDRVFVGTPLFGGAHENQAIIYPGIKKAPRQKPFITFHHYFEEALRAASAVAFIGFSFRDEYINSIFSKVLSTNAKVIVLNPSGLPEGFPLPKSRATIIEEGFNETTAKEVASHLLDKRSQST